MAENVLTDAEMQAYIEMAERDEWDPERWDLLSSDSRSDVAYVVHLTDGCAAAIEHRAQELGVAAGEYLSNLVNSVVAAM